MKENKKRGDNEKERRGMKRKRGGEEKGAKREKEGGVNIGGEQRDMDGMRTDRMKWRRIYKYRGTKSVVSKITEKVIKRLHTFAFVSLLFECWAPW